MAVKKKTDQISLTEETAAPFDGTTSESTSGMMPEPTPGKTSGTTDVAACGTNAASASPAVEPMKEADFEQGMRLLEEMLRALEGGSLTLAESLDAYRRGVGLVKGLHELLDRAEQQIVLLSEDGTERPIAPEEMNG